MLSTYTTLSHNYSYKRPYLLSLNYSYIFCTGFYEFLSLYVISANLTFRIFRAGAQLELRRARKKTKEEPHVLPEIKRTQDEPTLRPTLRGLISWPLVVQMLEKRSDRAERAGEDVDPLFGGVELSNVKIKTERATGP